MAISAKAMEQKLSKYHSMARTATKELESAGLEEFQVVARWDSEVGVDTFYLRCREDADVSDNWVEVFECDRCPSVIALASDAIVLADSWDY